MTTVLVAFGSPMTTVWVLFLLTLLSEARSPMTVQHISWNTKRSMHDMVPRRVAATTSQRNCHRRVLPTALDVSFREKRHWSELLHRHCNGYLPMEIEISFAVSRGQLRKPPSSSNDRLVCDVHLHQTRKLQRLLAINYNNINCCINCAAKRCWLKVTMNQCWYIIRSYSNSLGGDYPAHKHTLIWLLSKARNWSSLPMKLCKCWFITSRTAHAYSCLPVKSCTAML